MLISLERIGLTPGESEVYQALTKLGSSTAGDIIDEVNLASSKVYEILKKLIKKGLANYVTKNNVKHYDATPPERLLDYVDKKIKSLDNSKKEIKEIIPDIIQKRKDKELNNVSVYTGKEGARIVLKDTIETGRKGAELCGYGTDEDPYKDYLPEDIEEHFRDQKKYKVKWKLLFTKGKWRSPSPLADIKYLPKGFNLPIRTMIYGDKVAIVDFHGPIITIIIESKEIASSYKKHFDFLWGIAKR